MRGIVLTDIHVDPLYNPTASPANGCLCREECSNTSQLWTGHFSRPFGQRGCGAPPDLLDHILASAAREVPSPDFVFLLGDLLAQSSTLDARHRASTANYSLIMREYYPTVTSRIAKAFPSAVKSSHGLGCAVALGNNDVHPDYEIGLNVSSFYMWQAAAIADLCGLSELEATSFRRGGFYARSGAPGGPRLAVLNTAPYSSLHGPPLNVTSHPDPFGQFVWLEAELTRAAAQRTPLLILGHMPPVLDFYDRAPLWQEAYAARYWELMKRHSSAVAGQFFGHSHMTQFRVWGGVPAEAQAPLLVMGSVSPKYGNNPSFAVVTLGQGGGDEEEGGAVDLRPSEVRAYYADLASAKDAQTPRVELLYSTATRLQCCKQPNITSCCTPLSQSPPPSDAARLTNARYDQWAESMTDDPAPTAASEAEWWHFHSDLNARAEPAAPGLRGTNPLSGDGGNCTAPESFGHGCRVCTHGCRAAWLCLLRHGVSSRRYTACVAEAVADEQRAEAHLLATKAKATLAIETPYIARHVRVNHEAKRRAAVEEALWRHEQMAAKVREEDLRQEQTSFARRGTLTEPGTQHAYVPTDASPAVPESPGGASPKATAAARLPSTVLSPAVLDRRKL